MHVLTASVTNNVATMKIETACKTRFVMLHSIGTVKLLLQTMLLCCYWMNSHRGQALARGYSAALPLGTGDANTGPSANNNLRN